MAVLNLVLKVHHLHNAFSPQREEYNSCYLTTVIQKSFFRKSEMKEVLDFCF